MILFEPIRIGSLSLKNRIVMPAMGTGYGDEMGFVTERLRAYLEERARGGAGLIIVECTCVESQGGRRFWRHLCVDSDRFIPRFYELTEAIHQLGAKIALQLHHAGRLADPTVNGGIQPVSASPVAGHSGVSGKEIIARELSVEEVEALVGKFVQGVCRAKRAGFDAVEFHGAHGFLIGQFLSPFTNHRTDEYGKDLPGRMRFALEIVRRSKEEAGRDFPLIFRISADEYVPGGLTLEETKVICRELERAGIDALHISAGDGDESPWIKSGIMPAAVPPGCLAPFAEEIKKIVRVPVVAVGRINDPRLGEKILREGKADLVAMARALLADPHLPRKAFREEFANIRKCIGCSICPTFVLQGGGVRCTVDASLGQEKEERVLPFPKRKRVLVVGGGPAGLEVARCAALRGHAVTLYEKEQRLGGQVNLAARAPHKGEMLQVIHFLAHQLKELGAEVILGEEVTAARIQRVLPDAVILATGAVPSFAGVGGPNSGKGISTWDVLGGQKIQENRIVITDSSSVALEVAELLANAGKEVAVLSPAEEVGAGMESRTRFLLLQRLQEKRVRIIESAQFGAWRDQTVFFVDQEGKEQSLPAEVLISPVQRLPNQVLAKELVGRGLHKELEMHLVGDCLELRSLYAAIHDGHRAGLEV